MRYFLVLISLLTLGCSTHQLKEGRSVTVTLEDKTLLSDGSDKFTVHYNEYLPPKNQKILRAVVIMPPTGGENLLDRQYAKALAKKGAHVKIATSWSGDVEKKHDLAVHQRFHSRAVKAIDVLAKSFPESLEVSLLGTSVGGLFSSIAASKLDSVNRVFVIGAGISIPEVIVNSTQKAMQDLKEIRYKDYNFKSDKEYANALENEFHIDPLELPPNYKSKKLGLSVLLEDKVVPTENQLKLKNFWNAEKLIELDSNHKWGIIKTWLYHSKDITTFLVPEKA